MNTDVIVVGAGASGIPAAIAAARGGAKVVLLEEDANIGGAPVDNYICMQCGWPSMGIHREMVDKLEARFSLHDREVQPDGGRNGIWYLPSSYQLILHEMIRAEKNIILICGSKVTDVMTVDDGNRIKITGVRVSTPDKKIHTITGEVVIDATGNGDVAWHAGCEVMYGREGTDDFGEPHARKIPDNTVMPCTWIYILHSYHSRGKLNFEQLNMTGLIDSGYGWYSNPDEEFHKRSSGLYLGWGPTVYCDDPTDDIKLADTQQQALELLHPDMKLLSENGFGVYLAPKIGVRETRRIVGDKILTENDLRSGKFQDDTVAIGKFWLDNWCRDTSITNSNKKLPPHGIPYSSLIPLGFEGLLITGRCISSTHIANSALRVQPVAAQTGQAAGTAAAIAAVNNTNIRDIDISALRNRLILDGIDLN